MDVDTLRVRAFPFGDEIAKFIAAHPTVFVVEQNRDGQLRMLLINECSIDPQKLVSILHYDGTRWSSMTSGTPLRLRAVWGTASHSIFAVGAAGVILRYNGATWQSMTSGTVSVDGTSRKKGLAMLASSSIKMAPCPK